MKQRKTLKKKASLFSKEEISFPLSYARKPVLIIAGEASGDLLGSELILALRSYGFSQFIGTGGTAMANMGVELIEKVENMSVMGLIDALKIYRRLRALAKKLLQIAIKRQVKLAILIDYPGFNLRLSPMLKKNGIQVIYLVSPQLWAWKYKRIFTIKKNVNLMLPLFSFEEEMYQRQNILCHSIGHPLTERIHSQLLKEKKLREDIRKKRKNEKMLTVGLFPGSRYSEVTMLLNDIIKAVKLLHQEYPRVRFLLSDINCKLTTFIQKELETHPELPIEYYFGCSLRIIQASDILIVSSGTVTLEAAYFRKPMVILYKLSWINLLIFSIFVRMRYFGIVNLLARKQVAPELFQTEITPQNIANSTKKFIEDPVYTKTIVKELDFVRKELGSNKPSRQAARYIVNFLKEK